MTDEKIKQKRIGMTSVTSVSLSKEFRELIDRYKISPTDAIRKGISIELFERGLSQYNTETNRKRHESLKEILKLNELEDLPKELDEMILKLNKLKKLINWD